MGFLEKALVTALIIGAASTGYAQEADDNAESALAASVAAERAKKRTYPGGRDEQDLSVQPSLPQAVRSPEAQSQVSTPTSEVKTQD